MILIKLAIRNLFRHSRRSLLVMSMMIGGFTAIVLFRGFSHHILELLAETTINTQTGHIQIAKQKLWDRSPVDTPREYLLENMSDWSAEIAKLPGVDYVSGRTEFFGLLNGGDQSVSTMVISYDPDKETRMRESLKLVEGQNFTTGRSDQMIVGSGLKSRLRLQVGQFVTLVAVTFDGAMNAMDYEVAGAFQSGAKHIDDSSLLIPLDGAKRLLDTENFEKLVVVLKQRDQLPSVSASLAQQLKSDPSVQVKDWMEIAQLYRQVDSFWRVQNALVGTILFTIVFLGILNTVGMSVFERTGEIGTVRALGDRSSDVLKQFLLEGLALGLLASLMSIPISFGVGYFLNILEIPLNLPGSSAQVTLAVDFLPSAYALAALVTILTTLVATLIPALRATRLDIVEALRRNI